MTNSNSGNDADDDGENHAVDAIVVDEDDVFDAIESSLPDQSAAQTTMIAPPTVPVAPVASINTANVVTPDIIASVINGLNSEADATTSDE